MQKNQLKNGIAFLIHVFDILIFVHLEQVWDPGQIGVDLLWQVNVQEMAKQSKDINHSTSKIKHMGRLLMTSYNFWIFFDNPHSSNVTVKEEIGQS